MDVHMNVAEVKRRFAEVIARVNFAGERIIVERRGRPVAAIVSLRDLQTHKKGDVEAFRAAVAGLGTLGDEFADEMERVVSRRLRDKGRDAPDFS